MQRPHARSALPAADPACHYAGPFAESVIAAGSVQARRPLHLTLSLSFSFTALKTIRFFFFLFPRQRHLEEMLRLHAGRTNLSCSFVSVFTATSSREVPAACHPRRGGARRRDNSFQGCRRQEGRNCAAKARRSPAWEQRRMSDSCGRPPGIRMARRTKLLRRSDKNNARPLQEVIQRGFRNAGNNILARADSRGLSAASAARA